jgi:twitching motility protein PilT
LEAGRFLGHHEELEIDKLFRFVVKNKGSDLHLKVGLPPYVRIDGTLRPLNREPVSDEEMIRLIFPMLDKEERRKRIFDEDGGVDFAYQLPARNGGSG